MLAWRSDVPTSPATRTFLHHAPPMLGYHESCTPPRAVAATTTTLACGLSGPRS